MQLSNLSSGLSSGSGPQADTVSSGTCTSDDQIYAESCIYQVIVPHNQDKNKDSSGEADSLDLPSDTEAIVPEPTEEPSDKDKKDK